MDNLTKQTFNYGDREINYQRFPLWDSFFSFSYHKSTLFEKKYDFTLINLISMHHLKPLVSSDRSIKNENADVQIALCTDTVQILCITTLHGIISYTVCVF